MYQYGALCSVQQYSQCALSNLTQHVCQFRFHCGLSILPTFVPTQKFHGESFFQPKPWTCVSINLLRLRHLLWTTSSTFSPVRFCVVTNFFENLSAIVLPLSTLSSIHLSLQFSVRNWHNRINYGTSRHNFGRNVAEKIEVKRAAERNVFDWVVKLKEIERTRTRTVITMAGDIQSTGPMFLLLS